jgi:hypothetical protein
MRTTITFEPDVAAKVKKEMKSTGASFKQAVNAMLRRSPEAPPNGDKPFKLLARDMGLRKDIDLSNVWKLIEELEGPWHK